MSTRWPLKSTRGFSATPRWKRSAPKPNKAMARSIVRKAGPQENAFFTNSTLVSSANQRPTTYSSATDVEDIEEFAILNSADWSSSLGSRERMLIKRLDVNVHLQFAIPAGAYPFHARVGLALVAGDSDDITNQVVTLFGVPWGTQSNLAAFADLPKSVRYLARKEFYLSSPPLPSSATTSDRLESATAFFTARPYRKVTLTCRRKWLREPERVALICYSLTDSYESVAIANKAAIAGYHTTLMRYATY